MKKRVGTLIEEGVVRHAKCGAAQEGRPLSHIIQDALVSFFNHKAPDLQRRERAYHLFCEQPMRISKKQFKEILGEGV